MSAWIPVTERLPDDNASVLVALAGASEPVWIGYHDAEGWFCAEGGPVTVTHWQGIPEGPQ